MIISETWFNYITDKLNFYSINGFNFIHSSRVGKKGGGLAIYIKNNIKYHLLTSTHEPFHKIKIELLIDEQIIKLVAYYRPPNPNNSSSFMKDLESELDCNLPLIIAGDINIDVNKQSQLSNEYTDMLSSYNATLNNEHITRPSSGTLIDHVITSGLIIYSNHTVETSLSDHNIIISCIKINSKASTLSKTITKSLTNYDNARSLCSGRFNEIIYIRDPNEQLNIITDVIVSSINQSTTTKTFKVKENELVPWLNFNLLRLMKRRENIASKISKLRKYNLPSDKLGKKLISIISKIDSETSYARNKYYDSLFSTRDIRKTWKHINEILGKPIKRNNISLIENGNWISNIDKIVNIFNRQFLPKDNAAINLNNLNSFSTIRSNVNSIFIEPATTDEIKEIIDNLNTNKAKGHDEISPKSIKALGDIIAEPLARLLNNIITTAKYPNSLKKALVSAVHKTGDSCDKKNYRPISILPIINKIFEKILLHRLETFTHKAGYHDVYQYGFRKGCSTETALIDFFHAIHETLDKGDCIAIIFLDIAKAFDTVPHEALLSKLETYGIRGLANDLIRSFLKDRFQAVKIQNHTSTFKRITKGIPQGSICSPFMYNIMLDDFKNLNLFSRTTRFADDICFSLSFNDNNINETIEKLIKDTETIIKYHKINGLNINPNKSKLLFIKSPYSKLELPKQITLPNNATIERVSSHKYLGFYIDETASMDVHIKTIINKIRPAISILSKAKYFTPTSQLLKIYYAHVHSHLQYLAPLFGVAAKKSLKPLQVIQNRALKHVFKLDSSHSTISLFTDYAKNILPIKGITFLTSVIFVHKMKLKISGTNLTVDSKVNNRRSNGEIIPSSFSTNYLKRDISFHGYKIYNNLSRNVKNETNLHKFKHLVKKKLHSNVEKLLSLDQFSLLDI